MVDEQTILSTISLNTDIVIRLATAEDIPALEWGGEFWRLRTRFEKAYEQQEAGHRLMLIAALNEYPVGRLIVQLARGNPAYVNGISRAYLYSLHVMMPLRRQGIGTALIEVAEQLLIERAYKWVTIAVAKDNDEALDLYRRLGYRIFREDPGQWSYVDPAGEEHQVEQPSWVLQKRLRQDGG